MPTHRKGHLQTNTYLLIQNTFNLGTDSEYRIKLELNTELLSSSTKTEPHKVTLQKQEGPTKCCSSVVTEGYIWEEVQTRRQ